MRVSCPAGRFDVIFAYRVGRILNLYRGDSEMSALGMTRRTFFGWSAGVAVVAVAGRGPRSVRAAQGETTLLSVGIAAIPTDPFAWRLVRDAAPAFGAGEALERALGFVYSPEGRLRMTSDAAGGSGLVFAGKAAFIQEAVIQRQESVEGVPLSYLRVGLVPPEDAGYGATGDVLFGSIGYPAPAGRRAIRLYRIDLAPESEVAIPASDAPVLIHNLDGRAGIDVPGGSAEGYLSVGKTALAGRDSASELVVKSDTGATVLMAAIGEIVPEQGTGRISFAIFACTGQGGSNESEFTGCDLSNSFQLWLDGEGISLTEADLLNNEGDMVTPDLPYGTYILSLANDYGLELTPRDEGTIGAPDGNTQVFYPITLTPENPTVSITLRHPV